jgi:hypothetical protein
LFTKLLFSFVDLQRVRSGTRDASIRLAVVSIFKSSTSDVGRILERSRTRVVA